MNANVNNTGELNELSELPALPPWYVWEIEDNRGSSSGSDFTLNLVNAYPEYSKPHWFKRFYLGAQREPTGRWFTSKYDYFLRENVVTYSTPEPYTGGEVRPARRLKTMPSRDLESLEIDEILAAAQEIHAKMRNEVVIQERLGQYPPKRLSSSSSVAS